MSACPALAVSFSQQPSRTRESKSLWCWKAGFVVTVSNCCQQYHSFQGNDLQTTREESGDVTLDQWVKSGTFHSGIECKFPVCPAHGVRSNEYLASLDPKCFTCSSQHKLSILHLLKWSLFSSMTSNSTRPRSGRRIPAKPVSRWTSRYSRLTCYVFCAVVIESVGLNTIVQTCRVLHTKQRGSISWRSKNES